MDKPTTTEDYPTTIIDGVETCVVCDGTEHTGHEWDCPL